MRICVCDEVDFYSARERWRGLFGVTSGRLSSFHAVT
jgi:hypothetical protein